MLLVQHRINVDFQNEVQNRCFLRIKNDYKCFFKVKLLNQSNRQYKLEYERKLKEYSEMLDQRALRIQKLENQLRAIAYGRKNVQVINEVARLISLMNTKNSYICIIDGFN